MRRSSSDPKPGFEHFGRDQGQRRRAFLARQCFCFFEYLLSCFRQLCCSLLAWSSEEIYFLETLPLHFENGPVFFKAGQMLFIAIARLQRISRVFSRLRRLVNALGVVLGAHPL